MTPPDPDWIVTDPLENWSRARLVETIETQREMLNDRPDLSSAIYVSVAKGRARVLLPNGRFLIVPEGEGLHIWPRTYGTRREPVDDKEVTRG